MFCLGFHVSFLEFGVVGISDLVDSGLARSEAALIRSNQCIGVGLQSFAQYARKDLICDRGRSPIFRTGNRALRFQSHIL